MKKNNQGQIIILTILGIAILFVSVIGATFAYFSVNLKITETEKQVFVKSKALVIEYKTINSLYYDRVIPGRPTWLEGQKPTNQLSFSLTSPTDMLAKNEYDVFLNIEKNNFVTNNVVYYIKEKECIRDDGSGSVLGKLSSTDTLEYDLDGEIVTLGRIPAGYTGRLKIGEGAVLGGLGCTDEWEVEIWLHEVGVEQNEDQSKMIKATVEVETGELLPLEHDIKPEIPTESTTTEVPTMEPTTEPIIPVE